MATAPTIHEARALDPAWPSDDCCDQCAATPVREVLDGDKLCQSCCEAWARAEGAAQAEHEAEELRHELRHAGLYRGVEIEARLAMLDGGLRRYDRLERRAGGRVK